MNIRKCGGAGEKKITRDEKIGKIKRLSIVLKISTDIEAFKNGDKCWGAWVA